MAMVAPTPAESLVLAADIAREVGLRHVYVGNAPEVEAAVTSCARCGEVLIARHDYAVTEWHLVEGRCPSCRHALAGVGLEESPVLVKGAARRVRPVRSDGIASGPSA
jgi:pyruvate formate lyase activating enzyme